MVKLALVLLTAIATMLVTNNANIANASPAVAAGPTLAKAPVPACGSSFQVTLVKRTIYATTVKVVGVGLSQWLSTSDPYGLVYASANGHTDGPYNASRYSGANFTATFPTVASSIYISLDNSADTITLCQTTKNV